MKLFKKAIAMYISVILVTSVLITFLFIGILNSLYSQEDPLCAELDYHIENTCALRDGVQLSIRNSADLDLELKINSGTSQIISGREIKVFKFGTATGSKIIFEPIITVGKNQITCNSKNQKIDSSLITTACN